MLRRGGTFVNAEGFQTPVIRSRGTSNSGTPVPPTPASWTQSPTALNASPPWTGASQDGERYFDDEDTPTPPHRRRSPSPPMPSLEHSRSPSPVRALTRLDVEEAERARARSRSPRRPAGDNAAELAQFEAAIAIAMQQPMDTQLDAGQNSQVHGVESGENDQDADAEDGRQPPSRSVSSELAPSVRSQRSVAPYQARARPSTGPPSLMSSNSTAQNATAQNATATSEFDTNESVASNATGSLELEFFDKVRGPIEAALTKKQRKEEMYLEAQTHGFDMRHAIGGKFVRALKEDQGLAQRYQEFKGFPKVQQKQAEFRRAWAGEQYRLCVKEKEKLESWKKVDILKGNYCTFEILVTKFGYRLSELAIVTALNYAAKCKIGRAHV